MNGNGTRLTRRRLAVQAIVGGTTLIASACSLGKPRQSGKGASSAGTPVQGGVLKLRILSDLGDFDWTTSAKQIASLDVPVAYDRLLGFKTGPQVTYADPSVQGSLAEAWEIPEPQVYTFRLRKGVKFANVAPVNGRELTADDVKFSYQYTGRGAQFQGKKLPPSQSDWFFEGLDSIETPDPSTVVMRFKEPYAPFLNYSASPRDPIAPHEIYDRDGHFHDKILGTAAFSFDADSTQRGTRWVWKKNPASWKSQGAYLDGVSMLVIPDDESAFAAFRTKQIDTLAGSRIGPVTAQQLKRDNPTAMVTQYQWPEPFHLWMNQRPGALLSDERLRQAISLGMDRDAFVRTLGLGSGTWSLAGAFPDTFTEDEIKQLLHHDPAQARQLVSAAGYPDGVDMEFMYPGQAKGGDLITTIQLLQAQLKDAGIRLTLKSVDLQEASDRRRKGQYVLNGQEKGLDTDVDSYLSEAFSPTSTGNHAGVKDAQLAAMIQAQRGELDPSKRMDLVRQAVRYIAQHALGLTFPYGEQFDFSQPYLREYHPNFGEPEPVWQAWLAK